MFATHHHIRHKLESFGGISKKEFQNTHLGAAAERRQIKCAASATAWRLRFVITDSKYRAEDLLWAD